MFLSFGNNWFDKLKRIDEIVIKDETKIPDEIGTFIVRTLIFISTSFSCLVDLSFIRVWTRFCSLSFLVILECSGLII
jgi:hypothetical protein